MRKNSCVNNCGYSLIEILIVLVIVGLGLTAVAVNIPSSKAMLEPEAVMAQTASVVLEAKGQSLLGSSEAKRTFNLNDALNLYHNGVEITVTPTSHGQANCNTDLTSLSSSLPTPNKPSQQTQRVICVSGQPTYFNPTSSFTFERFSGKLAEPHAIFITNSRRKLALIISSSGDTTIAELINDVWYSRTDLQDLILNKQVKEVKTNE
ncbi:MAG: hypothetical protein FD167_853 [bacterium]|nr:MAG: hypothetical protein FD167_853 [bacterium]